jgi:hypothetical protein
MVCADIGMEIARATRMVAAGWSFLFILLNATTGPKTAHFAADFAHLGNGRKVRFV